MADGTPLSALACTMRTCYNRNGVVVFTHDMPAVYIAQTDLAHPQQKHQCTGLAVLAV